MDFSKHRLSIEDIKKMDLIDYLSNIGYKPNKIRNADHWYLSPLRNESSPSFKVNRNINCWYDHGIGCGGNIIDFGILYYKCSVADFLQKIDVNFSFLKPVDRHFSQQEVEHKITVIGESSICSFALFKYLEQRKIPFEIANRFCREVHYKLNDKIYYGIGFKNDSGGYEIRNPYFKTGSSPKDITTFNNGSNEASVFEGFIDFLSFISVNKNHQNNYTDFLILNSVSFFEKARTFMENHEVVKLYLDTDSTGQNYSKYALSLSKQYQDESKLYKNYKDFNEWLMKSGNNPKKHLGHKLR